MNEQNHIIKNALHDTVNIFKKVIKIIILVGIVLFLLILFFANTNEIAPVLYSFLFIFFSNSLILICIAFAITFAFKISKARKSFWIEYAKESNFEHTNKKDIKDEEGLIFEIGHSRRAVNCISGTYKNKKFDIFEYRYTIGSGKNSQTHSYTIFELKLDSSFPHLFLDQKKSWDNITNFLPTVPLNAEFEKMFRLHAPKEYEIEALQIFTPDTLEFLLDNGWEHDLELVHSELIIHRKKLFNSKVELEEELEKIHAFIDHLMPKFNNFRFSKIGNLSTDL